MKTIIYLVRHAEVENPNEIIYGRLPHFTLSDRGINQAKRLGEYFKDKNIEKVFSSPLLRARKTALFIAGKKKIKYSRKFLEVNYSKWEGLMASKRPRKEVELYIKKPEALNLGETLDKLQKRVVRAILRIAKKHKGKELVIVSHADPIIVARLFFENKPLNLLNKIDTRNASITSLVFDDKLQCEKVEYKEICEAKKGRTMILNDEQWGDLRLKAKEKFSDVCDTTDIIESEDDLGHRFEIKIDKLSFASPLGELKIERETRPKIIDKKAHYHKGSGGAQVEYVFSPDEKTYKVDIYKKDDVTGEWVPFDIPGDKLAF